MSDTSFQFQPPKRTEIWANLALTMSQAAALTGVSERQIQHWMDRGYIRPSSEGTRKINGEGLDHVVLIRQARIAGIPLRRAVRLAQEYLQMESSFDLDGRVAPATLQKLDEQLGALCDEVVTVQEMLRAIDVRAGARERRSLPARRANRV
ncbi:MAG TPA: MerR family transcriptional regulator [Chloroflexota bacterium]